jgi:hypothetical protein
MPFDRVTQERGHEKSGDEHSRAAASSYTIRIEASPCSSRKAHLSQFRCTLTTQSSGFHSHGDDSSIDTREVWLDWEFGIE